jgi:plastocyanin
MVKTQSRARRRLAIVPGAVVAVTATTILAACGGSSPKTDAATNPAPAASAAATSPSTTAAGTTMPGTTMPGMTMPAGGATAAANAPAVSGNKVSIKNFAFSPADLTVPVGTTVTWTNEDSDAHTVTSGNGPLHSPTLNTGDTYQYTFTKAGTYSYLCSIHPFMTGTVKVTG